MRTEAKRRIGRILKFLAAVFAVAILAGITYEQLGQRKDRRRFPQVGHSVDIGGRSLNINCAGEGNPAVILDTGGSAPGLTNLPLQALIAKLTRTCWFDRAGLGWSDPSSVTQTGAAIADDLHALLHAAGVAPPYILVGQSFSGFNVRVFAGKYPSEGAGIVLLDSVQEDQQQYEPRSTLAPVNRLPREVRSLLCRVVPLAVRVGVVRLLLNVSGPSREVPPGLTKDQVTTLHGLELQPKSFVAGAGCNAWEQSAAQARAAGKIGDLPLMVLTAGKPLAIGDPEVDKELAVFHEIWVHQLQPKLAQLSIRGRQVIVENSIHGIAGEMPGAAVDAIREVLSEVRAK